MISTKTQFNILLLGSQKSGKATTIGQFVLKCGNVDPLVIENFQQGHGNKYTWALNYLKDERENGYSDPIPYCRFETSTKIFQVTEAPCHQHFFKNLISQGTKDQIGLVFVSANNASGVELLPQLTVAKTLGIKQFIVCVNKLDEEKVAFSQSVFEDIQKGVSELFTSQGFDLSSVTFIPISGLQGDNLFEKSSNLNWYTGKTLLDTLENVSPFKPLKTEPLRLTLSDQHKISEVGTVLSGRIESGILKIGMTVSFFPVGVTGTVKSFETISGGITDVAEAGDNMGFTVDCKDTSKLTRGVVCGNVDTDAPKKIDKSGSFDALITVDSNPEQFKESSKLIIDCHTAHFTCHIKSIGERFDKNGKAKEALEVGDIAFVTLTPENEVCLEAFRDYPALGRFGIRGDQTQSVGVGIIKSITQ